MIDAVLSGGPGLQMVMHVTIFAAAGIAASHLLRYRAARAHHALLIALVASAVLPGAHVLVRHFRLGMLPARPAACERQQPAESYDRFVTASPAVQIERVTLASTQPEPASWGTICLGGWIILSAAMLGRLALRVLLSLRLLTKARPVESKRLHEGMTSARARMRVAQPVQIGCSRRIESPVIWCWTRRPIVLVPAETAEHEAGSDWTDVFCHELAHLKRRDHVSGLFAELIVAAIPWHPLLWWVRARLARFSEQACDDWVLAAGYSGLDYAETLLGLAAQRQMAFIPAVRGKEKTVKARISRIVGNRCGNPRIGGRWTAGIGLLAAVVVAGISLVQPESVRGKDRELRAVVEQRQTPACKSAMPDWQRKTLQHRLEELSRQIAEKQAGLLANQNLSAEDRQAQEFDLDLLREMAGQIELRLRGAEDLSRPPRPSETGEWVYRDNQWVLPSPQRTEIGSASPGDHRGGEPEEMLTPGDGAQQRISATKLETRVYALQYVDMEKVQPIFDAIIKQPETVTVFANDRKAAVYATTENHLRIERILGKLDTPADSPTITTEVDTLRGRLRQLHEQMEQIQRRLEEVDEQSRTKTRTLHVPPVQSDLNKTPEHTIEQ